MELTLFAQNCVFQVFAEDKDDNRLEMLFSVAIIILLYFVIMQTFFQGRKSSSANESSKDTIDQMISDHLQNTCDTLTKSQLFLNQIEDIYEIQQEKQRKKTAGGALTEEETKREALVLNATEEQIHQAACKTVRDLMQK